MVFSSRSDNWKVFYSFKQHFSRWFEAVLFVVRSGNCDFRTQQRKVFRDDPSSSCQLVAERSASSCGRTTTTDHVSDTEDAPAQCLGRFCEVFGLP